MAVVWLWRDAGDKFQIASQMEATFWYILPSLPMFLLVPAMLGDGMEFWLSLALGCLVTFLLYLATAWLLSRFAIQL